MSLSMPQTRKVIRKQEEVAAQLRKEVRAAGITGFKKQRRAIRAAASGRPADIRQQALKSLSARRVQKAIDMIAGRA